MDGEIGYDSGLVLLSILIAMLTAYTAFDMASRMKTSRRISASASRILLLAAAGAMGIGIWSMHFVGMLAYQMPMGIGYNPWQFVLSILSPIVFSGFALWLVIHFTKSNKILASASLSMATGIISMHYIGMAAIESDMSFHYGKMSIVVASLVAYVTSWVALSLFHFFRDVDHHKYIAYKLSCGVVMGAAISSTHYIGMSGTHLVRVANTQSETSNSVIGYILVTSMVIIYGLVLTSAYLDRKKANDSFLVQSELEKYQSLFTHNNDAVFLLDEGGRLVNHNPLTEEELGYSAEELKTMNIFDFVEREHVALIIEMMDSVKAGNRIKKEMTFVLKNGTHIEVSVKMMPLILCGRFEGVYCIVENISELKKREREISRLNLAIEASAEGIAIITKEGDFLYVNGAFAKIYGHSSAELHGVNWSSIADDSNIDQIKGEILKGLGEKGFWQGEWTAHGKNDVKTPVRFSLTMLEDNSLVCTASDITEAKRFERKLRQANEQLTYLSNTDPLTSIANRRGFEAELNKTWKRAKVDRAPLSILILDVDCFKEFNDTYGHQKGDDILRFIAQTLDHFWQVTGLMFARYGGEEFIVLAPELDADLAWELAEEARAYLESCQIPHETSPHGIVTISVGVATTDPLDMSTPEQLIDRADRALYKAKNAGRNRVEN